jgi:hypothetical protein
LFSLLSIILILLCIIFVGLLAYVILKGNALETDNLMFKKELEKLPSGLYMGTFVIIYTHINMCIYIQYYYIL